MYTHEELIEAVRAAGCDGKTFSTKDIRKQLGFESHDKKELSRFRRRLRAFEKAASEYLEKVGNGSYRLKAGAFERGEAEVLLGAAAVGGGDSHANVDPVVDAHEDADQHAHEHEHEVLVETEGSLAAESAEIPDNVVPFPKRPVVQAPPEGPASTALQPNAQATADTAPTGSDATPEAVPAGSDATAEIAVARSERGADQPVRSTPTSPASQGAQVPSGVSAATPEARRSTRVRRIAGLVAHAVTTLADGASAGQQVIERARTLRQQFTSCALGNGSANASADGGGQGKRPRAVTALHNWIGELAPLSSQLRERCSQQLTALRRRVDAARGRTV